MNTNFEQTEVIKASYTHQDLQRWIKESKSINTTELTFGEWDVHILKQMQDADDHLQPTRVRILERSKSELIEIYAKNQDGKYNVQSFVLDYLESQQSTPEVKSFRDTITSDFIQNLPLGEYEKMLFFHQTITEKRRSELRELTNTYQGEFLQKLLIELEDGFIDVPKQEIIERLNLYSVDFIDDLLETNNQGTVDSFNSLHIVTSTRHSDLRKLLFHELFHCIEGGTHNLIYKVNSISNSKKLLDRRLVRHGFNTYKSIPNSTTERLRQYNWLTEGLTEMMALAFEQNLRLSDIDVTKESSKAHFNFTYRDQRMMIDAIRLHGKNRIPIKYFIDAYLESYDENQQSPSSPKLRTLFNQIDSAYSKGYLNSVQQAFDEYVRYSVGAKGYYALMDFARRLFHNPYDVSLRLDHLSDSDKFVGREKLGINTTYQTVDGAEKYVYPVTYNGKLYAAKIYKQENSATFEPIDWKLTSLQEYQAYDVLRTTPLQPYIPIPKGMIQNDNGENIGLLLQWRSGKELNNTTTTRVRIPKNAIDTLEAVLLELPSDTMLDPDCLSESNICWDGKHIWFAELKLSSYESEVNWQDTVRQKMSYLRSEYGK